MIGKSRTKIEILTMMLPYGCIEKCAITSKIKLVANISPIIQEMLREGLIKEMELSYREKKRAEGNKYVTTEKLSKMLGEFRKKSNPLEALLEFHANQTYGELIEELIKAGYLAQHTPRPYNTRSSEANTEDEFEDLIEEAGEPEEAKEREPEEAKEREPKERRKEGRLIKKTYIAMTKDGIDYLLDNASGNELLERLTEEDINYTIMGQLASHLRLSNINRQTVVGFLRSAGVDYFANKPLAGSEYVTVGEPGTNFASQVLKAASELNEAKKKDFPLLYDIRDVRQIGMNMQSSPGSDKSHYGYVTATHLLITPARRYIIYRAKKDGTALSLNAHRKTEGLVNRTLNFMGEPRGNSTYPVIVMVTGKTEFRKSVEKGFNAIKVNKRLMKDASQSYGYPADKYYIIPMNWNGAQIMKTMLGAETTLTSDYQVELARSVRKELDLLRPEVRTHRASPMVLFEPGCCYCIGTDMNVQRIFNFDRYARIEKQRPGQENTRFVVLIREWQEPYLEDFLNSAELLVF